MKTRFLYHLSSLFIGLCLIVQLPGIELAQASPNSNPVSSSEALQILQSTSKDLVLEIAAPAFTLETAASASGTCQVVTVPGWGASAQPGQPDLPAKGWLVGLPAQGDAAVAVENIGSVNVMDGVNLCPAAGLTLQNNLPGELPAYTETRVKDPTDYQADQDFPGKLAEIGSAGTIRSQRVGNLKAQPFQYNPVLRRLSVYNHLRIQVTFNAPLAPSSASGVNESTYESILQNTIVNYAAAQPWRTSALPKLTPTSSGFQPGSTQPAYRISVPQNGIYQVSYANLLAAGIPAATLDSLDPRTFRLYNGGNGQTEVSLWVEGIDPAVFGPQDGFLFYGQKNNSRYSDTNSYWLTWGGAKGQRMAVSDGTPGTGAVSGTSQTTTHVEQNLFYIVKYPNGPNQDHWYWDIIQANNANNTKPYTINLTNVSSAATTPAVLRGLLRDYSSTTPQHTRIYLNGQMVKEGTWPANSDYLFEIPVSQSLLVNGTNTVKVEVVLDTGITLKVALVNWFEIAYTRDYVALANKIFFGGDTAGPWKYSVSGFTESDLAAVDITDPLHPAWIINLSTVDNSGGQFTLVFQQQITRPANYAASSRTSLLSPSSIQKAQPSDLLTSSNGADYIIISYPDFMTALQPLADFHSAQGLRTKIVNVQDIYDEFSGGNLDPQAIHDFLSYAYTNWTRSAPTYVLLAGDGNYDFKNYLGSNEPNFIPPYLADVDPWLGEIPTDNRYVTVSGNDNLPDMAVGRLPVKTAAETTAMVSKILNYTQAPVDGWTQKFLAVADKLDLSAGNFPQSSDLIADFVPSKLAVDKIYYTITQPTAPLTTTAVVNALNDGRLIVNYTGHASTLFWSPDHIFGTANVASMTNPAQLPFFISMACSLGYFVYPPFSGKDASALDEVLVRDASGGAIAAFSPTGFGLTTDHDLLNQGLLQAIFNNRIFEFGRSTTQAKYFMVANSAGSGELVDTFLLLGDPALQIKHDPFKVFLAITNN